MQESAHFKSSRILEDEGEGRVKQRSLEGEMVIGMEGNGFSLDGLDEATILVKARLSVPASSS